MTPPSHISSAVIVGAGIVGASAAYFLTELGVKVRLLDAQAPAAQATGAADGAVSVASKRPGPMMSAALAGIELYRKLARDGLFADVYQTRSSFIVAASDAECALLETHATALTSVGVGIERLAGERLRQRYPVLSPNARLAIEVQDEGHAIGYKIVHRLLTAAGVNVERASTVDRLLLDHDGHVRGVATEEGALLSDAVIIAAGNGSARLLGLDGVLRPRKGQLLVTERAPALNAAMPGAIMSGRYLLSKGSQAGDLATRSRGFGLVIDPLGTGQFLIGGTREDSNAGQSNDLAAVSRILADAVSLVPGLANVRLLRAFAGVRTAVADGLPLIGALPGLRNAYLATGFEGDGICLGPVAGRAIAQLACAKHPAFDITAFDPGRFAGIGVAA
ncbi:FAD-dependent oxidoreductase (plasmid) [Aminobacter sp. BA135]|uniref:NAD(P)/FAD-dependent oxidoreductase n=1 Tax=Aminobacter sp. BA135 TaxID=537596 RepID=UPI003D798DEA